MILYSVRRSLTGVPIRDQSRRGGIVSTVKTRNGLDQRAVGRLSDYPRRRIVTRSIFCLRVRAADVKDPIVYAAGGTVGRKPPAPLYYLLPNPANHSNSIRVYFEEVEE